jgi:hypothetical protein
MSNDHPKGPADSRRGFLRTAGIGAVALRLGAGADASGQVHAAVSSTKAARESAQPYNILFLLVDQERLFQENSRRVIGCLRTSD